MSIYGDKLLARLEGAFVEFQIPEESGDVAVFEPQYAEFGSVVLRDDGDEVTVFLGNFTHAHFQNDEDGTSEEQRAERVADAVIQFLQDLFSDKIEVYKNGTAGGFRYIQEKPRSLLFRLILGKKALTWSGDS